MGKAKFYTPKTLQQETQFLTSEKAIFKARTIWRLASFDWKLKRVSFKRLEQAKKLYNAVRLAWRYKDKSLEYDSVYNEQLAKRYSAKEDKALEKIKALCKPLGLSLVCSTWAHIYANKDFSEIM